MALHQIEPQYTDWITKSQTDFNSTINEVKKSFKNLNNDILYSKNNDKKIESLISDIRKKLLYSQLAYDNIKIYDKNKKLYDDDFKTLQHNMELIESYEQKNILAKQKKSIDTLVLFSIIFLPLTFITGYFGMNFGSQGSPTNGKGVFSMKYGQTFVFSLFFISIILIIIYFKYIY